MNRFLKVKKHMREKVRKTEKMQGGMIQANLANSEYSKHKNQTSLIERNKKMILILQDSMFTRRDLQLRGKIN